MNAAISALADEEEQLDETVLVKACHALARAADVAKDAKREPLLSRRPAGVIWDAKHTNDVPHLDQLTPVVEWCGWERMASGHNYYSIAK
ncbi:MAG: hypothetical protein ABIW82_06415 [Dokdonella sp.]